MQDLSNLLPGGPVNVLTPTSQQGGNQIVSNERALTAPGSQPASPATSMTGEVLDHAPPEIQQSGKEIPVGSDGKVDATPGSLSASSIRWTTTPSAGSGPAKLGVNHA